jgi:adenylate kinase family enzyme
MEPTVVLLGPPGSGKGTQAERLRDQFGFATLATGGLLRDARLKGTDLGLRASQYGERDLLRRVDGAQDADAVEAAVRAAIDPLSR